MDRTDIKIGDFVRLNRDKNIRTSEIDAILAKNPDFLIVIDKVGREFLLTLCWTKAYPHCSVVEVCGKNIYYSVDTLYRVSLEELIPFRYMGLSYINFNILQKVKNVRKKQIKKQAKKELLKIQQELNNMQVRENIHQQQLKQSHAHSVSKMFLAGRPLSFSNTMLSNIPSAVLYVHIGCPCGTGYIAIVEKTEFQNDSLGIYSVKRAFSINVMLAVLNTKTFKYGDVRYHILSCDIVSDFTCYLKPTYFFNNTISPQIVYVFAHKHISHFQQNDYESVTALIPCSESNEPVQTTVFYEKKTGLYFVNEETYTMIRKKYGLPYLRIRSALVNGTNGFAGLRAHSELNLLGYTVNAIDSDSKTIRQQKLADIIDGGILSKHEIISHLEWLINTRQSMQDMINAIHEWQADLNFVYNYKTDVQRKVWCDCFQTKRI